MRNIADYIYANGELVAVDVLAHHGIKGQRWGVRRFQKKDGTLTSAGKKRYSDESQRDAKTVKPAKRSRQDQLYSKYKTLGYSDKDAKEAAAGKAKAERIIKIVGGVAVGAVAAYAAYRYYDNHHDRTISANKIMQTVHDGSAADRLKPGNPFYATFTKADNTIYSSKVFSHFKDTSTVTKFVTDKNIKIASEASAKKTFNELLKTNPEVAKYVADISGIRGKKDGWDKFQYSLVLRNESATAKTMGLGGLDHDKVHGIFYDALKSKGYGGLIDVNDSKSEGFTWNPVILFDSQRKNIVSSQKATDDLFSGKHTGKAMAYSLLRQKALKPVDVTDPNVIMGASVLTLFGVASAADNVDLNRKVRYVEQYKADHPNTSKTNAQIVAMYERGIA